MRNTDTICALSTPPGEGGIGIIRISGPRALEVAARLFRPSRPGGPEEWRSHTIHYGAVVDPHTGELVDEALATVMRAPATYTREDVVEINCHGGMMPLARTLSLLIALGARQAEPGEFTKRAFLNGRIDLAQAEAVMDVIRARTERALQAATEQLSGGFSRAVTALRDRLVDLLAGIEAGIDFPEEDIDTAAPQAGSALTEIVDGIEGLLAGADFGRILRDGFATAIVGRPNVGKSSLLNALLRRDRAIVTDVPGTTRDVLEEYVNVSGVPLRIVDTAGIRETHDMVEREGVKRSLAAMAEADLVLLVLDASEGLHDGDRKILGDAAEKRVIAVLNKSDRPRALEPITFPRQQVEISCATGAGLDALKAAIAGMVMEGASQGREHAWAANQRHRTALEQTHAALLRAGESLRAKMSPEFIALDLREGLDSLGVITGATYTEDILNRIFDSFCIGK